MAVSAGVPWPALPAVPAVSLRRALPARVALAPRRPRARGPLRLADRRYGGRGDGVRAAALLRRVARHAVAGERRRAHGVLGAIPDGARRGPGVGALRSRRRAWTHPTDKGPVSRSMMRPGRPAYRSCATPLPAMAAGATSPCSGARSSAPARPSSGRPGGCSSAPPAQGRSAISPSSVSRSTVPRSLAIADRVPLLGSRIAPSPGSSAFTEDSLQPEPPRRSEGVPVQSRDGVQDVRADRVADIRSRLRHVGDGRMDGQRR